jgi:hypothetical protein
MYRRAHLELSPKDILYPVGFPNVALLMLLALQDAVGEQFSADDKLVAIAALLVQYFAQLGLFLEQYFANFLPM